MHEPQHDALPADPDARFEASDVSPRAMVKWAIGLLVLMLGSMLVALVYYVALGGAVQTRRSTPVAERRLQPWPRLQANPAKDLDEFEREQAGMERSYAWVDPTRGIVRIPVDRAMELVIGRGLPNWQAERPSKGVVP
ncbi:MAG: hypothetical protein FJX72_03425 [Armatimonadetes bacterium]|nr:hypothetical protein [Armatimonadota bacterium]